MSTRPSTPTGRRVPVEGRRRCVAAWAAERDGAPVELHTDTGPAAGRLRVVNEETLQLDVLDYPVVHGVTEPRPVRIVDVRSAELARRRR